ncbi:hypothetical protein MD484_g6823, partial [Candolleomyces efflorescens]
MSNSNGRNVMPIRQDSAVQGNGSTASNALPPLALGPNDGNNRNHNGTRLNTGRSAGQNHQVNNRSVSDDNIAGPSRAQRPLDRTTVGTPRLPTEPGTYYVPEGLYTVDNEGRPTFQSMTTLFTSQSTATPLTTGAPGPVKIEPVPANFRLSLPLPGAPDPTTPLTAGTPGPARVEPVPANFRLSLPLPGQPDFAPPQVPASPMRHLGYGAPTGFTFNGSPSRSGAASVNPQAPAAPRGYYSNLPQTPGMRVNPSMAQRTPVSQAYQSPTRALVNGMHGMRLAARTPLRESHTMPRPSGVVPGYGPVPPTLGPIRNNVHYSPARPVPVRTPIRPAQPNNVPGSSRLLPQSQRGGVRYNPMAVPSGRPHPTLNMFSIVAAHGDELDPERYQQLAYREIARQYREIAQRNALLKAQQNSLAVENPPAQSAPTSQHLQQQSAASQASVLPQQNSHPQPSVLPLPSGRARGVKIGRDASVKEEQRQARRVKPYPQPQLEIPAGPSRIREVQARPRTNGTSEAGERENAEGGSAVASRSSSFRVIKLGNGKAQEIGCSGSAQAPIVVPDQSEDEEELEDSGPK